MDFEEKIVKNTTELCEYSCFSWKSLYLSCIVPGVIPCLLQVSAPVKC